MMSLRNRRALIHFALLVLVISVSLAALAKLDRFLMRPRVTIRNLSSRNVENVVVRFKQLSRHGGNLAPLNQETVQLGRLQETEGALSISFKIDGHDVCLEDLYFQAGWLLNSECEHVTLAIEDDGVLRARFGGGSFFDVTELDDCAALD